MDFNTITAPTGCPVESHTNSTRRSLSVSEAVAITAVVCVVVSFTAGLVLGVLLRHYSGYCHRKQTRGQTEKPPVYEDITPEKGAGIQLQHNEAYDHVAL